MPSSKYVSGVRRWVQFPDLRQHKKLTLLPGRAPGGGDPSLFLNGDDGLRIVRALKLEFDMISAVRTGGSAAPMWRRQASRKPATSVVSSASTRSSTKGWENTSISSTFFARRHRTAGSRRTLSFRWKVAVSIWPLLQVR